MDVCLISVTARHFSLIRHNNTKDHLKQTCLCLRNGLFLRNVWSDKMISAGIEVVLSLVRAIYVAHDEAVFD